MTKFKIGDKVRCTGTSAGNARFGTGTINTLMSTSGRYNVKPDDGSGVWAVHHTDLEPLNKEEEIAFAKKFLTKDGAKMLEQGYLDVSISASDKMKKEMEIEAVEAFIKNFKSK